MATLTITIPDTAILRVQHAVAIETHVPAPATLAQVQNFCATHLRNLCVQVEQQQLARAAGTNVSADFPV